MAAELSNSMQLVERAKNGDRKAMNDLVGLWYSRIYHFAMRSKLDRIAAEEISQETFISVFQKLHQLKDINKFKPWVYQITVNHCHAYVKRQNAIQTSNESLAITLASTQPNGQETLEEGDQKELVFNALSNIPIDQREVVVLKEYHDLKFREIAQILKISENTAKSRMYYGLKAMRKFLVHHPDIKDTLYETNK